MQRDSPLWPACEGDDPAEPDLDEEERERGRRGRQEAAVREAGGGNERDERRQRERGEGLVACTEMQDAADDRRAGRERTGERRQAQPAAGANLVHATR